MPVPRGLLLLLCSTSFAISLNTAMLNPVLPDIARSFAVPVSMAGQLATISMVTGAFAALAMGILSDLYGRRPFVVGGLAAIGVSALALGVAPTFAWALLSRTVAGFGYVMAVNLATAGDWFRGGQRDRAVARILSAEALAWIVGVPAMATIAHAIGWRAGAGGFGVLLLGVAFAGLFALPGRAVAAKPRGFTSALVAIWRQHEGRPDLMRVLVANAVRNAGMMGFLTYVSALFVERHGLETWHLGPLLAVAAAAFMLGAEIGGRWAARLGPRAFAAWACVSVALFVALTPSLPDVWLSAGALAGFSFCGGAANAALIGLVLRLAPQSRGATMALNGTLVGLGTALGIAVAGLSIAMLGYPGLGLVQASFVGVAAGLVAGSAPWPQRQR